MQMNESTMRMFRDILRFSYQNNLFYRTLYDKHSIDVETCMLPDSLPFVSADDLVRCALKMKSNIPLYRVCASSGTKRSPKLIFRSLDDFKFSVQNQMRLMQWCGIDRLDIIGIVQPSGLWGYADLTQEAAQCMGVMSVQLGNAENAVALELINRLKVSVLDIAPSRLEDLLNMAIKKNITLDSVRIAMCSGEILSDYLRQFASEKFRINIYNQYGSEETDALGGEIAPGGGVQLFTDSFLFEICKEDSTPIQEGEVGVLTVTSLYHKGTPLIRYKLEDRVRLLSKNSTTVEILGRGEDYVTLYDSVKLHESQIMEIINQYADLVDRWQVRVSQPKETIYIDIHLDKHLSEDDSKVLIEEFRHLNIDINALYKNSIICFNLKFNDFIKTGRGKQNKLVDERIKAK